MQSPPSAESLVPDISSGRLEAIVSDFRKAIDTLRSVLDFTETSRPSGSLRVVIFNNTIVGLTAWIEESIRLISQEYLSLLEENIGDFRKLRANIQQSNIDSAIYIIKNARKSNDHNLASQCSKNLSNCLDGSAGYYLHKVNITYNQGNFRSQQFTDASKSIGLEKIWEKLANSHLVEQFTGASKIETRVTVLIAKWNEIFDERDLVVHRVSQASGWGPERIRQAIDLSYLVVSRLAECLAADCNSFVFELAKNSDQRLLRASSANADET